jgi:transposase-like protein
LAILSCPGCGRGGLRVPDGRRGKVTCPTCGAEWFHPETVEFSEVEFRCSKSGARFTVTSSRRSPAQRFVVKEIKSAAPAATGPSAKSASSVPQPAARNAVAPSLRLADPMAPATTHDATSYNWSGFSCPYCSSSSFVRCAGGHLACDGTAELRNGRRFHQCFCGEAGFINGVIQTIDDKLRPVGAELSSENVPTPKSQAVSKTPAATALPPPTKGVPPAKR